MKDPTTLTHPDLDTTVTVPKASVSALKRSGWKEPGEPSSGKPTEPSPAKPPEPSSGKPTEKKES